MSTATSVGKLVSIKPEFRPESISPKLLPSVFVILTSLNRNQKALEKACQLAESLQTHITILAVRIVPYPLQLDEPPIPQDFVISRFTEMTNAISEKVQLWTYLCRDPIRAIEQAINRESPVVIGIEKRWWPNRNRKLARKLWRAGYDVIPVPS